ncbi:MAG: hypothetical protein GIX03_04345 [Candidatus Eremiobacteraeota bacterium]|nr:hypothetical protein [Candidatus Eremiobacteraeota bacterium]MBC5802237.1 hypothetical protein [Candidatus Eremiobacteraeota bacterium]MBC5820573.1 hypothetical protein [Candidatus Eremiobacteraeota bacterium]
MSAQRNPDPTGTGLGPEPDVDQPGDDDAADPDAVADPDDPSLTEYDKTVADSFPASDPPAQP